jgi:large subunit ribosomal protein L15
MSELANLKPVPGAKKDTKRFGRGPGSGHGRYSGRGMKGQGSRTGKGKPAWFEGGQMPLQRRIPKRGFSPLERKEYAVVKVSQLERFEDGSTVDVEEMRKAKLFKQLKYGVKVLGSGDLTKKLVVVAHAFSSSAKEKIEKAGGKAMTVFESLEKEGG